MSSRSRAASRSSSSASAPRQDDRNALENRSRTLNRVRSRSSSGGAAPLTKRHRRRESTVPAGDEDSEGTDLQSTSPRVRSADAKDANDGDHAGQYHSSSAQSPTLRRNQQAIKSFLERIGLKRLTSVFIDNYPMVRRLRYDK